MTNEHLDELAELYVIGSLDELEARRVEQHAAACADCAQRLRQARDAVTAIESHVPLVEPPHSLAARLQSSLAPERGIAWHWRTAALAAAAVFAIALLPTWVAVDRSLNATQAMTADAVALARIAAAPAFDRATFMSPSKRPMDAKVLYGPHGDWYYVVIMHPRAHMQVAYVHDGRMEMLGKVTMHGASGSLYLPVNHKMDELALLEGDRVVADAHLVY